MLKPLFVVGTDTDVGKTVVCGLLARFLKEKKINVVIQKWIETGSASDIEQHRILSGIEHLKYTKDILPYKFLFSASPHLAAHLSKRKLRKDKIQKSFLLLKNNFEAVLVEGIGGALVPFNRRELVIDIVRELEILVLIVAKNRLGAINHTLLTIEALRTRNIEILGIIFNDEKGEKAEILADNPKIIEALSKIRVLGRMPYLKDKDELYKSFQPIGYKIWSFLRKSAISKI